MIQSKRSSYAIDHGTIVPHATKRHKADISVSTKKQDGKEKFGERISVLQQLVSPFGKTDTASVLLQAMEYIQFLHEQVKVLSAPYLRCSPATPAQEWEHYSMRSRGLCVVPISYTEGVAQTNGADLWAPMKTTSPSPTFDKTIPQFQ